MPIIGGSFILASGGTRVDISANGAIVRIKAPTGVRVTGTKGSSVKNVGISVPIANSIYSIYYCNIETELFDSNNPWTFTCEYNNSLFYSTIIVNDSCDYYIFINTNVPSQYVELEYLVLSSSSYFIVPTTNWACTFSDSYGMDVKFAGGTYSSNTQRDLYGSYSSSWYDYPSLALGSYNSSGSGSKGILIMPGPEVNGEWISNLPQMYNSNTSFSFTATPYNGHFKVTNSKTSGTVESTNLFGTRNGTFKLGGSISHTQFAGRIYYFKFNKNNTVYTDWVPCKRISDDVCGFYNKYGSGSFTTGYGTITGGPEVQ